MPTERETRQTRIDRQLAKAGWDVSSRRVLSATQFMFVRTLRKAVLERSELSSLDALRQPPFTSIGDPETLFKNRELDDLLHLALSLAA